MFGKEVSRDIIAALRGSSFIASGPRSPMPGAPYTYVTTPYFPSAFGMETLRDLANVEALEDADCSAGRRFRMSRSRLRRRARKNKLSAAYRTFQSLCSALVHTVTSAW